ncbi:MAG TPA: energy transducer TonB [Terriglobales bacterium]|nr:energy transducer TonB [Terriglobales bacterium]
MFPELRYSGSVRLRFSQLASFALHTAALLLLVWPETPVFVSLSEVARGEGGKSTITSIYLPRNGFDDLTPAPGAEVPRHIARRPTRKPTRQPNKAMTLPSPVAPPVRAADDQTSVGQQADSEVHGPRAGSLYGSLAQGPLSGPEVKPALPIVGPVPVISRNEMPPGVEGSVIIEITIDERGNLTGTKLVQRLGYGIDERVLSALQKWHFKPATRDGVAIASQQLCVFHFPSGAG